MALISFSTIDKFIEPEHLENSQKIGTTDFSFQQ